MRANGVIAGITLAITCIGAAPAQNVEYATLGKDALAFHEDIFRERKIRLEAPVVFDVEIFVELVGLPNIAKINALRLQIRRSLGLRNAAAVFFNDYRTIVYDPDWAKSVSAEFYLVLGHEAGHHFCGHTVGSVKANPFERELEADRFSGASIRRFEVYHGRSFINEALATAREKYSESGNSIYPPRAMRIEAIERGYREGSPCGGLAPVLERGYTAGRR
jgi:hypothetical protein